MKAFIYTELVSDFTQGTFKAKKYIYKVITENGDLIKVADFKSDKLAIELLPMWLEKDGYEVEFIHNTNLDPRFKKATEKYSDKNLGIPFNGEVNYE